VIDPLLKSRSRRPAQSVLVALRPVYLAVTQIFAWLVLLAPSEG
jgi:hypothetical protein